jgi:hypothetical protein
MRVTKKIDGLKFSVSQMNYEINLPAGLRVKMIIRGSTQGKYFLDEFPCAIFPVNSPIRHDAEYYGVLLGVNQTEDNDNDDQN